MDIDCESRVPTVQYGHNDGFNDAPVYYRVCPVCGRYVKADERSTIPEYLKANATCKIHGRVKMPFAYWAAETEETEAYFAKAYFTNNVL